MSHYLGREWGEELRIFRGIASEADDFPIGMVRQLREPKALAHACSKLTFQLENGHLLTSPTDEDISKRVLAPLGQPASGET